MKTFITLLITITSFSSAFSYPITATIVFENNTDKTSISGVFHIEETNQTVAVNSLDDFTIELPKIGKYHFGFYSEDVNAWTSYPVRITDRKNTITIRLESKSEESILNACENHFLGIDISNLSIEQFEERMTLGTINFIVHGLVPPNPEAVDGFKIAYGVGFTSENCVVDPISFKIATATNKRIEAYLTSKFGENWKNKVPATPFGLQLNPL